MTDFVVGGLLITPFVRAALLAAVLMVGIRFVLVRLRVRRWFWHPLLAEAALYVCLVAAVDLVW